MPRLPTLLVAFVFAVLALPAFAQAAADCPPAAPAPEALRPEELRRDVRDRGLLWRLERDGRTSWLYGTVHVARPEWVVPGPRVAEALRASEVVALELDPADPEIARLFTQRGDAAREQRLLAPLRERIARLAERACLPGAQLQALRPMLQVMTLSVLEARRLGSHPELAIDAVLYGMARRLGKPVVALETPAAQLAAMQPASEADERVLLERGLQELESPDGRALLARLLDAWAAGDEPTLASYPRWCRCLDTPAEQRFFRRLNEDRNGPMAERIAALHAGGRSVFVAVGALHMTGPRALTLLLRERGFDVRRVAF